MGGKAARYRIGHGAYVSEFDQFLAAFLAQHPEVERERKHGWTIWWDKQVDPADLEPRTDVAAVKSYQYQ
jgi:hypothetical protein